MSAVLAPIEQALVAFLPSATTYPTSTKVPNPRPARFIRATRAGGVIRNGAQSDVDVLVECWGATESDAWAVAKATWEALQPTALGARIAPAVVVCRADIAEPVFYPDSSTGSARYQFLYSPTVVIEGASI